MKTTIFIIHFAKKTHFGYNTMYVRVDKTKYSRGSSM